MPYKLNPYLPTPGNLIFRQAVEQVIRQAGRPTPIYEPVRDRHEVTYLTKVKPTLGELMKSFRARLNISQAHLAQMLGVAVGAITRVETGAQQGLNSETKANFRQLLVRHPDLMEVFQGIDWPTRGRKPGTY